MTKRESRPKLVERLRAMWGTYYKKATYLQSVEIGDGSPLRGVKNSKLIFNFPVTVLCGSNGTGKTTFLSLSVLAFHGVHAITKPKSYREYFDFNYFFVSSDRDKHSSGIQINWEYTNGLSDKIVKGKERWMRYIKNSGEARRPERGTEFLGLSRIVPAFERRGFSRLFGNTRKTRRKEFSEELSKHLSIIMSKPYHSVLSYENNDSTGSYRLNSYNSTHTSFNSGAGEECLTQILNILLSAKEGSFIAIEEIEVGLHPATMEKLIDAILDIAIKRKLQIIITTHSSEFLRSCPIECLVQAERSKDSVAFTHMPNVENAIKTLSSKAGVSLYVVCEDVCAAELFKNCLPKKARNVVNVAAYGGQTQLLDKAEVINQATSKPVAIIWDGDADDTFSKDPRIDKKNLFSFKLPGDACPEKYIIDLIINEKIKEDIMNCYGLSDHDWDSIKDKVETIIDPHDLFFILATELKSDASDSSIRSVRENTCRFSTNSALTDFSYLAKGIEEITGT